MSGLLVMVVAFFFVAFRSMRKPRALAMLAVAAILSLGTVRALRANPGNPQQRQPAQRGGTLTIQQLGDALTSYGKNTVNNNGQTYYTVMCGKGTWRSSVIISLSPDGTVIWMTIDPIDMPDPGKTSRAAMLNLFKKNTSIGPMFYSIAGSHLRLSYPVPNYDLNTEKVKAYVSTIVNTAVETSPLWDAGALQEK